jgi:hypothetical protein
VRRIRVNLSVSKAGGRERESGHIRFSRRGGPTTRIHASIFLDISIAPRLLLCDTTILVLVMHAQRCKTFFTQRQPETLRVIWSLSLLMTRYGQEFTEACFLVYRYKHPLCMLLLNRKTWRSGQALHIPQSCFYSFLCFYSNISNFKQYGSKI